MQRIGDQLEGWRKAVAFQQHHFGWMGPCRLPQASARVPAKKTSRTEERHELVESGSPSMAILGL